MSEIQRYRKKPVVIDAWQVTYENRYEVAIWCGGTAQESAPSGTIYAPGLLSITTLEGVMWASDGDFVIREPFPTTDRQFYPCKPDIFALTYELAGDLQMTKERRIAEIEEICQNSQFVNHAICCVSCHTDEVVQIEDFCCSAYAKIRAIEQEEA